MILGINGPIGSGKNEVAKILEKNWGFKAVGFADKLKESAAALFGIDPEEWNIIKNDPGARVSLTWHHDELFDFGQVAQFAYEKSISGREFLKRYGTESHRDIFGYDFWVNALLSSLCENFGNYSGVLKNFAIYDARFDNELEAIHKYGGVNIQVRRPGHNFDPSHPSEAHPEPGLIDHIVHNFGSLEDLEEKVNELVRSERLVNPALLENSDSRVPSPLQQLVPDF